MMQPVPFFANTDNNLRCMLACYRSILAYFTGKTWSWDELDTLTGFSNDTAAWTLKSLVELQRLGFDIVMIEPFDYRKFFDQGEGYLSEIFSPAELDWQLKHSNILSIKKDIPKFLETINYECRRPTTKDIDTMLAEGRLVTAVVNAKILNGEPGYSSHMILIYKKDNDTYVAHDPGLPAYESRKIPVDLLWKAMGEGASATDVTGFRLS
ncbi:hypothetical protein KC955_02675 [Candidatus Saccharibacteria bacterium]|nr:hypothetical protein [Candidatus Saccharibacteria bacterium]